MDVRLSPEQQTLRVTAAQVVDRLAPRAVGQLGDAIRVDKLEAAVVESGWRELRTADDDGHPWASAVEVALVAEELARGCADVAFVGPTLSSELRRLAGASPTTELRRSRAGPTCRGPRRGRGRCRGRRRRGRDLGARARSGCRWLRPGSVRVRGDDAGIDLTRPTVPTSTAGATPVPGQSHVLTDDHLTRWTAFGLSTTVADLVGVMQGTVRLTVDECQAPSAVR